MVCVQDAMPSLRSLQIPSPQPIRQVEGLVFFCVDRGFDVVVLQDDFGKTLSLRATVQKERSLLK